MSAGPFVDIGVRCDRHVGEAFMPRCVTCFLLSNEHKALRLPAPAGGKR